MTCFLRLHLLLAAALAILAVAPSSAFSGEKVRIGVCLSLSGENSESGRRSLAGVRMRLEEWNRSGQQPLVALIVRDDQGNPAITQKMVPELVEKEKVTALIGPGSSQLLFSVRDYLRDRKVVAVSPSVTNPAVSRDNDWTFRLMFDDDFQSEALARFIFRNLNMRRAAAVLNTHYPYSESAFGPFAAEFERLGGAIVGAERFDWRDDIDNLYDFTDILANLEKVRPEMVFLPLYAPEAAELIRESLHTRLNTIFCGADTWDSELLLMSAGNNLRQAHYVSGMNISANTPELQHFMSVYNTSNEPYAEPSSIYGYDALSLLLVALKDGNASESIRDNLYKLRNYPLSTGPITIDRERGTLRPAYIHSIVKRGNEFRSTFVDTIWPEAMR